MNLSLESSGKSRYYFNLSLNPLFQFDKKIKKRMASQQWKFLIADNLKSFGSKKSQYQNEIRDNHLDKPFRQLIHVLQNTENLRKSDIYDIFNAQNIQPFLESLLRNTEKNYKEPTQLQYDFRTCEIARLMLELSSKYLRESPVFNQVSSVKELSKSLSRDYKVLSKSMLEKENEYQTISKEEQNKLEAKYFEIEEKVDSYPFETSNDLFIEIQQLDFAYIELKKLKRTNYMEFNRENRKEAYEKYKKRIDYETKLENNEFRNKTKLILEMRKKYNHISSYFSRIAPLGDTPVDKINQK